jgi:hypothetical protein
LRLYDNCRRHFGNEDWIKLVTDAVDLLKRPQIDPHEVQARLLELQGLMLEAREALSDAHDEKVNLEARITELTRMADIGKSFTFDGGIGIGTIHIAQIAGT